MPNRALIVTMPVDVTDLDDAVQQVKELSSKKTGAYICVSNVHMCMEVYDSLDFKSIVRNADLVLPDGKPLSWAQKLLGYNNAKQVRGQDITNALCQLSADSGLKLGFYGGSSPEILDNVQKKLKENYPGIFIAYSYSPPFKPLTSEENIKVVNEINDCQVDVLFVGIGCPKQERWMADHKNNLSCVMLGVGAVFDFIAGEKKHAPRWMQSIGMEWLFRLLSEPERLFIRYFTTNPRFLWLFIMQLISHKYALLKNRK